MHFQGALLPDRKTFAKELDHNKVTACVTDNWQQDHQESSDEEEELDEHNEEGEVLFTDFHSVFTQAWSVCTASPLGLFN